MSGTEQEQLLSKIISLLGSSIEDLYPVYIDSGSNSFDKDNDSNGVSGVAVTLLDQATVSSGSDIDIADAVNQGVIESTQYPAGTTFYGKINKFALSSGGDAVVYIPRK